MHRLPLTRALPALLVVGLLALPACERSAPEDAPTPSRPQTAPEAAPPDQEQEPAEASAPSADSRALPEETAPGWTRVAEEDLTPAQQQQLQKARAAQKKLGSTLKGRLQKEIADAGYPEAITVCNGVAPTLAKTVAEEEGVAIGRTSFKLRNQDNDPPAWARQLVEHRVETPQHLEGPDGRFATFSPIRLQGFCVGCTARKRSSSRASPTGSPSSTPTTRLRASKRAICEAGSGSKSPPCDAAPRARPHLHDERKMIEKGRPLSPQPDEPASTP